MSRVPAETPTLNWETNMRVPAAPPALTTGVNFVNILLSLRARRLRAMTRLAFAELMFEGQILTEGAARWIAESPKAIERAMDNIRLMQELSRPLFRPNTDLGEKPYLETDLLHLIGMGGYQN
jgi:hypothetical protein